MENRHHTPKYSDKTSSSKHKPESARRAASTSATSRSPAGRTTASRTTGTRRPPASQQPVRRPSSTAPRTTQTSGQTRKSPPIHPEAPRRRNAPTENISRNAPKRQQPRNDSDRNPPKKSGCALASLYFIFIFGISICLSLVIIFSANDVLALVKPDADIAVVVAADTTINEISKQLDDNGVVNYGVLFQIFNAVKGDGDTIVSAGTYTLNPTMDYSQILRALTKTTSTTTVKVTIPEGYTIGQVRQTLLDKHVTSPALLDNALNTYPFKHSFLKDLKPPSVNWLEGYLFPDTYEFVEDSKQPVHEVLNIMLNNFNKKYDERIKTGAENLGLSTHEVVTIASLIEREAKTSDEFAKISGVIHNRLNNRAEFPRLQIDAALQYAVGHNNRLTDVDKQFNSPYNLYLHEGLPPGPICNPGYNALYAATHPEEHGYYYYVAMPDGTHLFAKTNNQHNKNRAKAEKAWAKQKQ